MGTYLGIPLFHSKPTKAFDYLVDRAQKRLAKWKMSSISRVARLVLIKSTLLSLPTYAMQTCILPKKISKAIEKICRDFFWGLIMEKHTLYAVAWRQICQLMAHGGLGINDLSKSNITLVCKLAWKLIDQLECLSSQVLRAKYDGWESLERATTRGNQSYIWRSILKSTH